MKSRRRKSAQIRMAIGLVGIRVALIQLFPRGGAPPALRAVAPRWFLYVFMYGVVRQVAPHPPRLGAGVHCSEIEKPSKMRAWGIIRKYAAGLLIQQC